MHKIKLDCDACGAPLEIDHPGFYKCLHCGRTYLFEGNLEPTIQPVQRKKTEKKKPTSQSKDPVSRPIPTIGEEDLAKIKDLFHKGYKIQAIKLYMDNTGVGLKEAKDFVEAIK